MCLYLASSELYLGVIICHTRLNINEQMYDLEQGSRQETHALIWTDTSQLIYFQLLKNVWSCRKAFFK